MSTIELSANSNADKMINRIVLMARELKPEFVQPILARRHLKNWIYLD